MTNALCEQRLETLIDEVQHLLPVHYYKLPDSHGTYGK